MASPLRAQAISGVKWNGVSMGVITVLHFVTLAILARLLAPAEFGLMGMVMVVIGFAQVFAGLGLSNAIIQRQSVPENHLSSFFWVNTASGVVIFVFVFMARPLVAMYFKESDLSQYLALGGLIFLITPVGQIFTTLLRKELRFRTLSKIEIAGTAVYSVSAVALAAANFGVLSLILGQLVRSLFTVGILFSIFRKTWLPKFHFNLREISSYFGFGAFQMGEGAVNYLSANIDYIIIGRFLGPAALGFYTLAYQLVTFPLNKINPVITKVAFPAFSKIQGDNVRMRRGYCKVINYISMVTFPMLAGMLIVAPEFVRLVYGPKWAPSIIILQILCVVGAFKSLLNPIGSVLLAKGRADIGFYWNVFAVIMVSVAVVVGANWGIVGVAAALLILQAPFFMIIQPIVNRLMDLRFSRYFEAVQSPLGCSLIMVAGIWLLKTVLGDVNMLVLFATTVVAGAVTYLTAFYVKDRARLLELTSMLKGS